MGIIANHIFRWDYCEISVWVSLLEIARNILSEYWLTAEEVSVVE